MIRRPPRSTLSSSSAASDVYKRQDQREWLRGLGDPMAVDHELGSGQQQTPTLTRRTPGSRRKENVIIISDTVPAGLPHNSATSPPVKSRLQRAILLGLDYCRFFVDYTDSLLIAVVLRLLRFCRPGCAADYIWLEWICACGEIMHGDYRTESTGDLTDYYTLLRSASRAELSLAPPVGTK